ncbi:exoglucanase [Alternaria alternata]|nr:exoglucanase [Alternaria alternata]
MNFRSRGHWASQYPVPYLAPALLVEYFFNPPSASMETKYKAPLKPHGRFDTSTSKVCSRTDVRRIRALGDELQLQRVTASGNAICATVIGTVDGTVSSTCFVVWAGRRIPFIACIAVIVTSLPSATKFAPVIIEHYPSFLWSHRQLASMTILPFLFVQLPFAVQDCHVIPGWVSVCCVPTSCPWPTWSRAAARAKY